MSRSLRVLMLSWEYPPKITGGLGVACEGMAKSLAAMGHQVDVLLPKFFEGQKSTKNVTLIDAQALSLHEDFWTKDEEISKIVESVSLGTVLVPYLPPHYFRKSSKQHLTWKEKRQRPEFKALGTVSLSGEYNAKIFGEIVKYGLIATEYATSQHYDIIHAHDWITFKAGQLIQEMTNIPVFYHVHSVESDRNGANGNPEVASIEKEALTQAKYVIAVSKRLKADIEQSYGIKAGKTEVVANGISQKVTPAASSTSKNCLGFVGRFTHQKGPGHFINIAQDLRLRFPKINFEMIGDGYLMADMKKKAEHLNLAKRMKFKGFIAPSKIKKAMQNMDLLLVPSNSDPFGLVILEALTYGVPVVASPNTGIAEFIPSLPQIENWDTYRATQLITELLQDEAKRLHVLEACQKEAAKLTWANSARRISELYEGVIGRT